MWRSRTPPQHRQPGHTRVGWHPILLPAFLTSESVWLCWSHWHERHTHAEPTSVRLLRSGLQAGHSTLSSPELWLLINPALWGRGLSALEFQWLQNLILISVCTEIKMVQN